MTIPYDLHPLVPQVEKKDNNILTLGDLSDIIKKQIEKVLNLPPQPWGFSREDIVESLEEVMENMEKKCQN